MEEIKREVDDSSEEESNETLTDRISTSSSNQLTPAMLEDVKACADYDWSEDDSWTQIDFPTDIFD